MESGDGLIVRLRISGGMVGVGLAARVARWSLRWGNGQIDLTGRANLQLRGLSERHLPALHDAMSEWDLLDTSAAGEAVRNVISSPLSGLDPTAVLDIRPIVRALEQRLGADPALHDLPAKFGFVVDDGGAFSLADVAADIRFTARRGPDGPEFTIGLDGGANGLRCGQDSVVDAAAALSLAFVRFKRGREAGIRRMRDFVAVRGVEVIGREAGLDHCCSHDFGARHNRPFVVIGLDPRICFGRHRVGATLAPAANDARVEPEHDGGATEHDGRGDAHARTPPIFVGVGLPFGRIAAQDFTALASTAAACGAAELRLTPWRAILVPVASVDAGRALIDGLAPYSLILESSDPRLRVAACPGAPSCRNANTATRDDAAALAVTMANAPEAGTYMHVSGCEKGCAHPGKAPLTLVGREGRYDVVLSGSASSPPAYRNLTLDQIVELLPRVWAGHAPRSPA